MTHEEFYVKVVAMRSYQKDWFATRNITALNQAKKFEAEIDKEIERVNAIMQRKAAEREANAPKQLRLFVSSRGKR
jgi:hypothetical protein